MIDINLLPPEYAPRKLISVSNVVIIAAFFLIGLSLLLSARSLLATMEDYSSRVDDKDKQIQFYEPIAEDVKKIRVRIEELKPRLGKAKELLQGRITWSDKLVELYQCVPHSGVWIDKFSIRREEAQPARRLSRAATTQVSVATQPIVVAISGKVLSVDEMSRFVANLEESETFGNVVFDSVAATTGGPRSPGTGDSSFRTFKLTVQILPRVGE